jgi:hypothetical protein
VRPERLYITRVDRKTFVEVDEEGNRGGGGDSGAVVLLGVMKVIGD